MLKADIRLSDLAIEPTWQGGAWVFGQSSIRPHAHAMLESQWVRTAGQWFFTVRERAASPPSAAVSHALDVDAETYRRLYHACLLWPLDYLVIEGAQAGHRLRMRAGVHGTAPIYVRAAQDHVRASWDATDLIDGSLAIDAEMASHRLVMNTVYATRQWLVGIHLLTERATLDIAPGKASYRYPAPVAETAPAPLPDGQDALQAFETLLHQVITGRPATTDRIALELSGGMDSGGVACALAAHHGGIASQGILLDGAVRQPQVERRQRIVERLGLVDETVGISAYPPSLDLQAPARDLYWEYYLEACSALWQQAGRHGHDVLFTGVGGDELFPHYMDELSASRHEASERESQVRRHAEQLLTPRALNAARSMRTADAPASPVSATALLAHACRAPALLRHGMWPVNPLSDPGLAAFCHRLPRQHRHGRELLRRYLEKQLGPAVFAPSYVKETFAQVLPGLIASHAPQLARQLRDCALADAGLVQRDAVLALLRTVADTQASAPAAALACFLWMERFARQLR